MNIALSQNDSMGYDVRFVGAQPVKELLQLALQDPSVICFNSLGFLKSKVNLPLQRSAYFKDTDCLYVLKDRLDEETLLKIKDESSFVPYHEEVVVEVLKSKDTFVKNFTTIPFVIISWNQLYFLKKFIEQIKRLPNPIIVLDNNSEFIPLLEYYKTLKNELGERVDIRLLGFNYGHLVYKTLSHTLPSVFVLSDPDLLLHPDMPINVVEQLYVISEKYNSGRVGLALDLSDKNDFIKGSYGKLVFDVESQYYSKSIPDDTYELYSANTDTTFCLINKNNNGINLRVAGNFTAKHLPWYDNYLKKNIPKDELAIWVKNNKSSSILQYINGDDLLN